jgi:outer membrane protein TolC
MIRLGILLAFVSISLAAEAQTNRWTPKKMSLEDCTETALQHNLDVRIQRYNPEISFYTLKGQYGAYDPTLTLSVDHSYNQSAGGIDPQGRPFAGRETISDTYNAGIAGVLPWGMTYNIGPNLNDTTTHSPITNFDLVTEVFQGRAGLVDLRQPLLKNLWIDSTRLQILVDKSNLRISEIDLRNQVMNTVTAVEKAYYDLIYNQENIKVQQKAVELAERQLAENRKRVEVGAMAPLDEKQAQSLAAQSRADLIAALGLEESQQRTLKNLLSDNYEDWANVAIEPDQTLVAIPQKYSLQESWTIGLKQRPDVVREKLLVEQAGYQIKYSRNQLYPELDLIGSAGLNSSAGNFNGYVDQIGHADNPFYSIGGQITFPLSNTGARNNYKGAKARRAQTELQLKQIIQNAMIAIENSIATVNTDYQTVSARREARIYAEAALEAEQKKLESGKSTSFIVLQLTRDLTAARSAEIRALADYNQALADAALQEGSTLQRRHVTLEWK